MKLNLNSPNLKIVRENRHLLITVAVASALGVFCLASLKVLVSQALYQQHLISAKQAATKQLRANLSAAGALATQYKVFVETSPNIIGGAPKGSGPSDGDNAQIVLDALPVSYNFPGLTSSVDKILKERGISGSISGTDNSLNNKTAASSSPQPITISLTISATSSYANIQNLINDFMRSIRPFNINNLQINGNQGNMQLSLSVDSYYQAAKVFSLDKKPLLR